MFLRKFRRHKSLVSREAGFCAENLDSGASLECADYRSEKICARVVLLLHD